MNNWSGQRAWRSVVFLFVLTAMLLSACGGLIPTAEPVTLTFGCPVSDLAFYQSLLPGFNEKYPNITISFKTYVDPPRDLSDVMILPGR